MSEFESVDNKHATWYDFCETFGEGEMGDNFVNLCGDEKMTQVENWAKNFPEVKIVRCDDNHHAGSLLVLIPHPKMGITVVFVPQLTYSKDYFFLYPNHQKALLKALTEMKVHYPYYDQYDEFEDDSGNFNFKKFIEKEKGEE